MIRCALVVALCARSYAEPLLPFSATQLGNGVRVVLAPDPNASSVVVHVRYEVGAGDEARAEAGYTHLVERLLFAGTKHVGDFEARIEAAGGWAGSVTTQDHLSVFEQMPPEALELALWLEAERMASLSESITDAGLARAKADIAAEWRSAYIEQPSSLVARDVQQRLWPTVNLVLGDNIAVPRATRATIAAFARAHIAPTRTTLVIAGNFDATRALEYVTKYVGAIAPARTNGGVKIARAVPLASSSEHAIGDPIANVVVAFRLDEPFSDDALAIEVAARVLAGGRASRLQRRLVDGKRASTVDIELVRQRGGCELHIAATPMPGIASATVAHELQSEVAKLHGTISDDELERAKAAVDRDLVLALEGLAYRADALASWRAYGGAALSLDVLRARYRAVTTRALDRAIETWLSKSVTTNSTQ